MIIKKVEIEGLYGYINKKVKLLDDINLLVGINGSGKTTILNVIQWLTRPAIGQLCTTLFKSLSVFCSREEEEFWIRGVQGEKKFELLVEHVRPTIAKPHPLVVNLKVPVQSIQNKTQLSELMQGYNSMTPDSKELVTWSFLSSLPKPIIIGLERKPFPDSADLEIESYSISPATTSEPLTEVKKLARKQYSKYRNNIIELNEDLRDKFMLSAFEIEPENVKVQHKELSLKDIDSLEVRFQEYMKENFAVRSTKRRTLTSDKLTLRAVKKYFRQLRSISRNKANPKTGRMQDRTVLWRQFTKINRMLENFEEFDAKSKIAFQSISQYLLTLNGFLRDSAKRLTFRQESNELAYETLDKHNKPSNTYADIGNFSSGERQIVTLMTFIAFTEGKIFIIDEPELSLHPKWQDEFLDAVNILMAKGAQLILATHSPAIVGKYVDHCITLLPYND